MRALRVDSEQANPDALIGAPVPGDDTAKQRIGGLRVPFEAQNERTGASRNDYANQLIGADSNQLRVCLGAQLEAAKVYGEIARLPHAHCASNEKRDELIDFP